MHKIKTAINKEIMETEYNTGIRIRKRMLRLALAIFLFTIALWLASTTFTHSPTGFATYDTAGIIVINKTYISTQSLELSTPGYIDSLRLTGIVNITQNSLNNTGLVRVWLVYQNTKLLVYDSSQISQLSGQESITGMVIRGSYGSNNTSNSNSPTYTNASSLIGRNTSYENINNSTASGILTENTTINTSEYNSSNGSLTNTSYKQAMPAGEINITYNLTRNNSTNTTELQNASSGNVSYKNSSTNSTTPVNASNPMTQYNSTENLSLAEPQSQADNASTPYGNTTLTNTTQEALQDNNSLSNMSSTNITSTGSQATNKILPIAGECISTCTITGMQNFSGTTGTNNYTLYIEIVGNASLHIDSLTYKYVIPANITQTRAIGDISYIGNYTLNLSDYFNGNNLIYDMKSLEYSNYSINGDILTLSTITPGTESAYIYALSGTSMIESNMFNITVLAQNTTNDSINWVDDAGAKTEIASRIKNVHFASVKHKRDKNNSTEYELAIGDNSSQYNKLILRGLENLSTLSNVGFYNSRNILGQRFATPLVDVNSVNITNATIDLAKNGPVTAIAMCKDYNTIRGTCTNWITTNIPFTDYGSYIEFTVTHFTSYGGVLETSLAYVTGTTNYTTTGYPLLSSSQDGAINNVAWTATASTLYTMINASGYIAAGIIRSTDLVNFSSYWTTGLNVTSAYATFKLYDNITGTLICQAGNDNTGGYALPTAGTSALVYGNCTPSSNTTIGLGDAMIYTINVYASSIGNGAGNTITLSWDNSTANTWVQYTNIISTNINTSTDSQAYTQGNNAYISGYYTWANGSTIPNANVNITITNSTGYILYNTNTTTNNSGYYTTNYTIPQGTPPGQWNISIIGIYNTSINATTSTNLLIVTISSRINPTSANASDPLAGYCNISGLGGNVTYEYEWYNNGGVYATGSPGYCFGNDTYNTSSNYCTRTLTPNNITQNDSTVLTDGLNPSTANTNYGYQTSAQINAWTDGGQPMFNRFFINFNITDLTNASNIISAKLSLYWSGLTQHGNGGTSAYYTNAPFYIQRVTAPWTFNNITWNNQPLTTTTNELSVPAPTGPTDNFTNLNVTQLVKDIITNNSYYGFNARLQTEATYRDIEIATADSTFPTRRPNLIVTYTGPKQYYPVGQEINTNNISGNITAAGDTWILGCMVSNNSITTGWVNSTPVYVTGTSPPTIISSRIYPNVAYINNTLNGYCNATNSDGTNISYSYIWYLNGLINISGNTSNYSPGIEVNVANISNNLVKGQNWIISCKANSSTESSSWINSSTIIIQNTPPTLSTIVLNSSSGKNTTYDNLTAYFVASDLNNDSIYNITDWRKNGISVAVLNMPFDMNISSTAPGAIKDYSTYANNGILGNGSITNSSTWTTAGQVGGAYSFDGAADFIGIPYTPTLAPNYITLSAWVKFNQLRRGTYPQAIISKTQAGGYEIDENDHIGFLTFWINVAGTYYTIDFNSSNLTTGTFYQIVGTYDGTTEKLYINGTLVGTNNSASGPLYYTLNNSLLIGAEAGSGDLPQVNGEAYFNGTIDEVEIFNYSLSPEQIRSMYLVELSGNSENTIINNETSIGDNWTVAVTSTDTQNQSTAISNTIYISSIPSITTSRITPTTAFTYTNLNGYCNAANIDGTNINYYYQWYLNGIANNSGNTSNYSPGIEINVANITNTTLAVGQNWTLSCLANNSHGSSTWLNSSIIKILPNASSVVGITFVPPTPDNAASTLNNYTNINSSILLSNNAGLSSIVWNWNGTNYTFYNNSLVLMYNFNNLSILGENTSSNKTADVSSYGNNGTCQGTITGCTYVTGKYGSAIQFNGISTLVNSSNATSLNNLGPATWSLWINRASLNNYGALIYKSDNNGVTGWWIDFRSNNGGELGFAGVYSTTNLRIYTNTSIPGVGQWFNVVVTWNGGSATNSTHIYINGIETSYSTLVSASGTSSSDAAVPLTIGYGEGGTGGYFNGSIDEVMIWNRVLTSSDILQLYSSNTYLNNLSSWQFTINESNLSIGNYTYFMCANDSLGSTNCTDNRLISVINASNNPVITAIPTIPAQNPIELSTTIVPITFTVNDAGGNTTINISTARIVANYSGTTRSTNLCSGFAINATAINVSCNLTLKYYDPPGIWNINISINDTGGIHTENTTTFTYNELSAIRISSQTVSFGTLNIGDINKTTSPIIINNTGNINYTYISLTGYDLANASSIIGADNFTINTLNVSGGNTIINNTQINITGASLTRSNDSIPGIETLYIYLNIPNESLPAYTYNSISPWIIIANK